MFCTKKGAWLGKESSCSRSCLPFVCLCSLCSLTSRSKLVCRWVKSLYYRIVVHSEGQIFGHLFWLRYNFGKVKNPTSIGMLIYLHWVLVQLSHQVQVLCVTALLWRKLRSLGPQAQIGAAIYWPMDTAITRILHLKPSAINPDSFVHLQGGSLTMFRDSLDPDPILGTASVRWDYTQDETPSHHLNSERHAHTGVCRNRRKKRNIHINVFINVIDKIGWKMTFKHN